MIAPDVEASHPKVNTPRQHKMTLTWCIFQTSCPKHKTGQALLDACCTVCVIIPSHRRIRRFLDYTASAHSLYYITQLPPDRDWGTEMPYLLCGGPTGLRLRICMVGTLSRMQASASSVNSHTKFTVNLDFVRDVDRQSAQALLDLSHPRPCTSYVCVRGLR